MIKVKIFTSAHKTEQRFKLMTQEQRINKLYNDVASFYCITVDELIKRTTTGKGEMLIHQYYLAKYGEDFI